MELRIRPRFGSSSAKITLAVTAATRPASGSSNGETMRSRKSGSGRASLLRRTTYGVSAVTTLRRATLFPPAKPRFAGDAITRTHG